MSVCASFRQAGRALVAARLRRASTFSPRALNHAAYKEAIMREVVSRRLYKATDLRHLFRHFLTLAPIHDKEVSRVTPPAAVRLWSTPNRRARRRASTCRWSKKWLTS